MTRRSLFGSIFGIPITIFGYGSDMENNIKNEPKECKEILPKGTKVSFFHNFEIKNNLPLSNKIVSITLPSGEKRYLNLEYYILKYETPITYKYLSGCMSDYSLRQDWEIV